MRASGRRGSRTGIPALPRCHRLLKCLKPRGKDYPEEPNALGEHIKRRRLDLGLRQRDVAADLGVRFVTLCGWETGRATPETRYIPAIERFLGYCLYDPIWTFGERLRAAREAQGLSRARLSKMAGLDPATVARAEADVRRLARRSVSRLRQALFGRP